MEITITNHIAEATITKVIVKNTSVGSWDVEVMYSVQGLPVATSKAQNITTGKVALLKMNDQILLKEGE
jgi:hypothetical protein